MTPPDKCPLYLISCNRPIPYSPSRRKPIPWRSWRCTPSIVTIVLVILAVLCDIPPPVQPSPLPSSSAWSLPTLNYLFKDTKTRSQSLQYQKEQTENSQNGGGGGGGSIHHYKTLPGEVSDSSQPSVDKVKGKGGEGKVSSTGRLISVHDIRLTDNWGWVRRGVSDPSQKTEQRRKQNRNTIRHSKSKHKQRHYPSSGSVEGSKKSKKKKDNVENLLCPFDEIRGPDGKCRKAPRFSLYRVGRK